MELIEHPVQDQPALVLIPGFQISCMFFGGGVLEPHNHTIYSTRLTPPIISVTANGHMIYWLGMELRALVPHADLGSTGRFVLDCEDNCENGHSARLDADTKDTLQTSEIIKLVIYIIL